MSLIHDALKSMDAPQDTKPAMARAPKAAVRGRPAWLDAMLAFAVVFGAGILGWFVWQTQMVPKAAPLPVAVAPTPAPVPAPAVVAAPAAEAAAPAAVVESASSPTAEMAALPVTLPPGAMAKSAPAALAVPAAEVAPKVAVTPAAAISSAAPKSAAVALQSNDSSAPGSSVANRSGSARQVRSATRFSAPTASAAASTPAVDDTPVELRFARFVTAMKESRTADAERELTALKERLPAGSLGLLRAQAWFDLRAGRDVAAADGYRAILERLPGDEEAAINLASIQSRQLKTEEARATLDAASRLQPDSAALRAALAQFTPASRQ